MPFITGGSIAGTIGATRVYKGAGAPTVNVTLLGVAGIGDLYSDSTNGKLYIVTATNSTSTITWTVVGTQV